MQYRRLGTSGLQVSALSFGAWLTFGQQVGPREAVQRINLGAVLVDVREPGEFAAGHAADDYVHEHPWKAIGAAAGVGMIIGLLIGRR